MARKKKSGAVGSIVGAAIVGLSNETKVALQRCALASEDISGRQPAIVDSVLTAFIAPTEE